MWVLEYKAQVGPKNVGRDQNPALCFIMYLWFIRGHHFATVAIKQPPPPPPPPPLVGGVTGGVTGGVGAT